MSEGTFLNGALVAAAAAAGAALAAAIRGWERAEAGRWLLAAAGVALGGALAARWRAGGHAPLANQYESMVFLAFCCVPAAALRRPKPWIIIVASAAVVILLGAAALFHGPAEPLMPALQSNWLLIHVAVSMASYALFLLSALGAAWLLVRSRLPGPAPRDLDLFAYRTIAGGFFLLALSIVTGAVWANEAWGAWWSWDPKETWALITWIFYGVALHLRRVRGWRERKFAWLSLAGLGCVIFTYFGVNYLLAGLHSYAG